MLAVIAVTFAVVVTLRPDGGGDEAPPAVASGEQSAGEFGDAAETSAPADAPDLIDTAGLEALLPENSQLLSFLGLPADREVMRYERTMNLEYAADVHNCGPVTSPYDVNAYRGSGYTSVRYSFVRDPDENISPFIQRAWVGGIAFHNAEAAQAMHAKLTGIFESCAGRTVNLKTTDDDNDVFWGIGAVTTADGITSVLNFQEASDDWRCAHSVAQRSNVMLVVMDCSRGGDVGRSVELVEQMLAKIEAPQ